MADDPTSPAESTGDYAQLLPPQPRRSVTFRVAALTHTGLSRGNNEDHFLVARLARVLEVRASSVTSSGPPASAVEGLLILVADGMGGAEGGERASSLAVETLQSSVLDGFRSFLHDDRADEQSVARELRAIFERADRIIVRGATSDASLEGMGTTLTMAYVVSSTMLVLHAGDSRAYVYRKGTLQQVTRDHSLVQSLVDLGQLSADEARSHPNRNVVTNVLGGPSEGVEAEVSRVALEDGDLILVCSDGLCEPVDDAAIAEILAREPEPTTAAQALVDEALRRGGPDNVTVVLAAVTVER
jgi:serine/threonine protein phosphatase PrpC